MEFRILGALEVSDRGVRLDPGGVRNQKVLAALLLSAERVATPSYLVDVVWGEDPPSTSRHQIQKCVGELRSVLGPDVIVTDSAGYRLVLGEADLDQRTFERLVAQSHTVELGDAVAHLRAALSLWRGTALAGIESQALRADVERLEERRAEVRERCLALELGLGRHREAVAELTALVGEHPYRERLAELLMQALHGSGRRADALEVYQRMRTRLADDLGVEPGESLRSVHQSVLSQEPVAVQPKPTTTPAQLPADLARFTGRQEHLARLDDLVSARAGTVVITSIAGVAGVGKTALAVHWAHRARPLFPDGQLYVNLRGHDDAPPTTPADALAQFLRALGIDSSAIPREEAEQAALYRSLLADRRMLIVLDNAASEAQVRPLLPGSARCAVVITSRNSLLGLVALDDAHQVELDVLEPDEAHELIGRVLGESRAAAEPDAVAELAWLCGYLPLAMRIALANLVARPHHLVVDAVAELSGGDRLAKLAVPGDRRAAVTAAFDLSYRALPPDARVLFRRLGLLPRTDFTPDAAAALLGEPSARDAVLALEAASLIEPHTPNRYRMHDLLRLYAQDLVAHDPDRAAARHRLLEFYLHTTDAAMRLLAPDMFRLDRSGTARPFAGRADALSWLDGERESVVTLVVQCAEEGPREYAWQLTDAWRGYFWLRRNSADCQIAGQAALIAAEAESDPEGRAAAHSALATACIEQDAPQTEHWLAARDLYRVAGNLAGECHCLHNLGNAHTLFGRPARATELFSQALHLVTDVPRKALTLTSLGVAATFTGHLATARQHFEQALELFAQTGNEMRAVPALSGLGDVTCQLGDIACATTYLDQAAGLAEGSGSQTWRLNTLRSRAMLERDTCRSEQALETTTRLLEAAEETATSHYVLSALIVQGELLHHFGRTGEAVAALERGLRLARSLEKRYHETSVLIDLARVLASSEPDAAVRHATAALELADERSLRVLRGRALTTLASVHPGQARMLVEEALEVQTATGHLLGQAEALGLLGRADEAGKIFAHVTGNPSAVPAGTLRSV
ncbi:transcriptional regulator [Lentzea tibetensis]|uniref:Transcriptional regulator n=1 Tax=Lentzea tibetensis TaxID=2591470 RepID=A0A563EY64_9PSEU|nr:BTAD domain-containing putative transcriptional regulator [Lentzea tibetensis]TWP52084.1 transcriptional regulator [Lentzea tibetensis]